MAVNQAEVWFPGFKFADMYVGEEFPNRNLKDLHNSWNLNFDPENSCIDIVDLLPKDPFDMDIKAFKTITELIEDFSLKKLGFESGEDEDENSPTCSADLGYVMEDEDSANSFDVGTRTSKTITANENSADFVKDAIIELVEDFSLKDLGFESGEDKDDKSANSDDSILGSPPYALSFALSYLDLMDLLTVERVCKSLRDDVQNDPLLWRNIYVDYPLNLKISDDDLLLLAKRAQGTLQSLSLVGCSKITDGGVKRVLGLNPRLTKLNVVGCMRLEMEGIIGNLKFFKSFGKPGIERVRIARILGTTSQHFEEVKFLLGIQNQGQQERDRAPQFFRAKEWFLSLDNDRAIDIETCPRCQKIRQVYDCPGDGCKEKQQTSQACRACTFCISRCTSCGLCLTNRSYQETFHFELVCEDCLKIVLKQQEGQTRITRASYPYVVHR